MRRMLDPKELGGGGEGSTLYEYSIMLLDKSNLGIKAYGKFYSSVDIGEVGKTRSSGELYEQLLPGGSKYELSLSLTGYVKIDTTYYSLRRMTCGSSNIRLYYLDPAQGYKTYNHDFRYDVTNKWSVTRNVASPRQAN